jgi:hypothetical protein
VYLSLIKEGFKLRSMQKIRKWTIIFILLSPVLILVGMRVAWWFVPKKPMVVLAMDKTGLTWEEQNKQPLFWVLRHDRYVRKNGLLYDGKKDYLGLFPLKKNQYTVKDFQNMSEKDVQHIVSNVDVTYYIGTSGVSTVVDKRSGLTQRGMTEKDMSFLKKMKKSRKLILAEFNAIASPTKTNVRHDFENEFGIRWTGWIGRYFTSLDSTNSELSHWIIKNYMKQHEGRWPFTRSGIVFAHENGTVEILDRKTDLKEAEPLIHTFFYGINQLEMVERIPYTGWFDIIQMTDSTNHAISAYELRVNDRGRRLLNQSGIPVIFPAVIMHKAKDFEFYYFCGNYSDNKIPSNSSYFVGGQHLALMLDGTSKNRFFYDFFRPMLSSILRQYYNNRSKTDTFVKKEENK